MPDTVPISVEPPDADSRTVGEYLSNDHVRLDALVAETRQLLKGHSLRMARLTFATFAAGLNRHIEIEERILFPRFEEVYGGGRGPIRVMCAEHISIRELLAEARDAVQGDNAERALDRLDVLADELKTHNFKEEGVLYPAVDNALPKEELKEMVRAFSKI